MPPGPAGQIDYNTRTVTGSSKNIDIKLIKENPVLKPEVIKDIIYTDVGVLYGNMSDQSFKMYLAHYFSTLTKTGQSVLDCIFSTKNVLSSCKCCLDLFAKSNGDKLR